MSMIKGILFDSGRVLNYPRTGHWFIPPNFFNYVKEDEFNCKTEDELNNAFNKGMNYLNNNLTVLDEAEEYMHFQKFYSIVLNELNLNLNSEYIEHIAKDTVFNDQKFVFYEDVFEIIPKLSKKYKLGVVSDTWPSLDRVYRNSSLRNYFDTFVMSSILGINKPHENMFLTALNELNLKPDEIIFIDDNIRNCKGASELGIKSYVIIRDNQCVNKDNINYDYITNLKDLLRII